MEASLGADAAVDQIECSVLACLHVGAIRPDRACVSHLNPPLLRKDAQLKSGG